MKIKKQILSICLVMMIILMAGCGSSTKSTQEDTQSADQGEILMLNSIDIFPIMSSS
jgi:uncharacterized protein YceK